MSNRRRKPALAGGADWQSSAGAIQHEVKRQEVRDESSRIFKKMDADGSNTASREEIYKFVAHHEELWEKLSRKLNQPKDKARMAATRAAMELASGLKGQEALDAEITKDQFHDFRKKYILDPEGSEEFFQRAIFANFDADHSGELDQDELENFLGAIYDTRDVRKGRISLLSQDQMKDLIMETCDTDGDKTLSFSEVKNIMRGDATELNKMKNEKAMEEVDLQMPGAQARASNASVQEETQMTGIATSENWREKAEAIAPLEPKEESDFCDWLERKVTCAPPGGPKKGFCRKGGCVIS